MGLGMSAVGAVVPGAVFGSGGENADTAATGELVFGGALGERACVVGGFAGAFGGTGGEEGARGVFEEETAPVEFEERVGGWVLVVAAVFSRVCFDCGEGLDRGVAVEFNGSFMSLGV